VSSFPYLSVAARQAKALEEAAHRPWPPPEEAWTQAQTRRDVLFAHWRVDIAELARLLPPDLPLDTYEGEAWLGMVPFGLANLRLRGLPPVPRLSFGQLDIGTYVTFEGRPGIWLCSVDVSNPLLLEAAKRVHRLPAYRARISSICRPDVHGYTRTSEVRREGLSFEARYREAGEPFAAEPGSLDHFLTERYCIYTADGGRLYRAELHHAPWRLQRAEGTIESCTIAPVALEDEPHLLYSAAQDVLIWPLEEV
jgi:uncharacterized protein YqjF (DUF2071 family)